MTVLIQRFLFCKPKISYNQKTNYWTRSDIKPIKRKVKYYSVKNFKDIIAEKFPQLNQQDDIFKNKLE